MKSRSNALVSLKNVINWEAKRNCSFGGITFLFQVIPPTDLTFTMKYIFECHDLEKHLYSISQRQPCSSIFSFTRKTIENRFISDATSKYFLNHYVSLILDIVVKKKLDRV